MSSGNTIFDEVQSVPKLLRPSNVFPWKAKSATKEKRKKIGKEAVAANKIGPRCVSHLQ
jgi:hypothetical protein